MTGRGNGDGSRATRFVARTTCSKCDVTLTTETRSWPCNFRKYANGPLAMVNRCVQRAA